MINKPLLILAGGFGTRLMSILKGLPKPMADINGTPFLYFLFENWVDQGFDHFILSLHYESQIIINYVEELRKSILKNCKIQYVVEDKPLGTGGAISHMLKNIDIDDEFFIANADTWIENGYSKIDQQTGNIIGLVKVDDTSRYGCVLINDVNIIIKFIEKENKQEKGYINAGVYKLSKSLFKNWNGNAFSLERDLFPQLIKDKVLNGQVIKTNFVDIGIPEDYYKFCNIKKASKCN